MVKSKILQFLEAQYLKKAEPLQKKRKDITKAEDIAVLEDELATLQQKYQFEHWIAEAATRMAMQLSFSTHLSKGIHPDSKGDNINVYQQPLSSSIFVGSHLLPQTILDASGNAAALPLAAFFNLVIDEARGTRLQDLLREDSPLLDGAFAEEPALSDHYKKLFQQALGGALNAPATHERNKQLLWAHGDNNYTCIVPLYPSVLANHLFHKIQTQRYSEEAKAARESRKKANNEPKAYVSIVDLAITKLGGTKPQNISQLNSQQGGRHYLLPSLPPRFILPRNYFPASHRSFFNPPLYYLLRPMFRDLFNVVADNQNTYQIRDLRKDAIQTIAENTIYIAQQFGQRFSPGWSKTYSALSPEQKCWLDPARAELEGEEAFKAMYEAGLWQDKVADAFAFWINEILKKRFPQIANTFAKAEFNEWRKQFKHSLSLTQ